jgi:predicted glycosyltransferase
VKVWIDLSNSPHAPFFAPISDRLRSGGHEILVTARDNAQTVELARQSWDRVTVVGGRSLAGRLAKGRGMLERIGDLADWARRARPDVALSHNSYGQIVAARRLRIATVTAMDYEHQPANHLAFRLADKILLPAALQGAALRRQGATPRKVRFYDGLKEEVYLGDFEPSLRVLDEIGIRRREGDVLVVARTPPTGALYHRAGNPLFGQILELVGRHPRAVCVTLCRHPEQRQELAELGLANLIVPERAVDARSLLYAADLVVGAGGTMTREAALLGVPTVSIFAGRTPAVDRWLEQRGALQRLHSIGDMPPLRPRSTPPRQLPDLRARGDLLIEEFVAAVTEGRPGAAPVRTPVQAHG